MVVITILFALLSCSGHASADKLAKPSLLSPAFGQVQQIDTKIELTWTAVPEAILYKLDIAAANGFVYRVIPRPEENLSVIAEQVQFEMAGANKWHVQACADIDDIDCSDWSDTWVIQIDKATTPVVQEQSMSTTSIPIPTPPPPDWFTLMESTDTVVEITYSWKWPSIEVNSFLFTFTTCVEFFNEDAVATEDCQSAITIGLIESRITLFFTEKRRLKWRVRSCSSHNFTNCGDASAEKYAMIVPYEPVACPMQQFSDSDIPEGSCHEIQEIDNVSADQCCQFCAEKSVNLCTWAPAMHQVDQINRCYMCYGANYTTDDIVHKPGIALFLA